MYADILNFLGWLVQLGVVWVAVVGGAIAVIWMATRRSGSTAPAKLPRRGYYYVNPGQGQLQRWMHVADQQPAYTDYLARLLGYGPLLDHEAARVAAQPVVVEYTPSRL